MNSHRSILARVPGLGAAVVGFAFVLEICGASISETERDELRRAIAAASKSDVQFFPEKAALRERVAATKDLQLIYQWIQSPNLGLMDHAVVTENDRNRKNQLISMMLRTGTDPWNVGMAVPEEGSIIGLTMRYQYLINLIKPYVADVTVADLKLSDARTRLAVRFEKAAGILPFVAEKISEDVVRSGAGLGAVSDRPPAEGSDVGPPPSPLTPETKQVHKAPQAINRAMWFAGGILAVVCAVVCRALLKSRKCK